MHFNFDSFCKLALADFLEILFESSFLQKIYSCKDYRIQSFDFKRLLKLLRNICHCTIHIRGHSFQQLMGLQ